MIFDFFRKVCVHYSTGQTTITIPSVLSKRHRLKKGEVVKITVERDDDGDRDGK